jgi:hypothetical protein
MNTTPDARMIAADVQTKALLLGNYLADTSKDTSLSFEPLVPQLREAGKVLGATIVAVRELVSAHKKGPAR